MAPGIRINRHGYVHTIALLYSLKPDSVMSQPVFGVIDNYPDQFIFAQFIEQPDPFVSSPLCT